MSESAETASQASDGVTGAAAEIESVLAGDLPDPIVQVLDYFSRLYETIAGQILSVAGALQLAVIVVAALVALALSRPGRAVLARLWRREASRLARARAIIEGLVPAVIWAVGLWIGSASLVGAGLGNDLVRVVASLLNAWIVIRVFSGFVSDPFWSKTFAAIAWSLAALNILHLLGPAADLLDRVAIPFGDTRFSLYVALKGGVLAALLLWVASAVARVIQTRLRKTARLTVSVQSLIGQAVRLVLLFSAVMIALNAVGIDLTVLTVFSGAVGIGIGFGLQSIFSNLVAGIIMLLENSVRIGDFVEIEGGIIGEVREINIRSTLITTNANIDVLVPNSEFVNNRVTNWTLREASRRVHIPFGVAYGTDKDLVRKAVLEAAVSVPHALSGGQAREPQVWLVGFGESSLDFELVVWLNSEAVKRPAKVNADYNWAIETALKKYGLEIPFPQRDLHIRSGTLPVIVRQGED